MIDKLVGWLSENPRRLVAIERDFLVQLDDDVQIQGRVDRLEIDDARPARGDRPEDRQDHLGPQPRTSASIRNSAPIRPRSRPARSRSSATSPAAPRWSSSAPTRARKEQAQPPLSEAEDPAGPSRWSRATAKTMAASTFHAVANSKCRNCPVRRSCPVSGQGRQVTTPGPAPARLRCRLRNRGTVMMPTSTRPRPVRGSRRPRSPTCCGLHRRRPPSRTRSSPPRSRRCWSSPAPGSGKTETMAARVVWLVANDYVRPGADPRPHLHPQGGR